jgi:hypothetical protein
MAVGVMAGGLLQLGVQIPMLMRIGMLPRVAWRWSEIRAAWTHPGTQRVTHLMLPALLGVSVAQLSLLINTQIASHMTAGSVSWLSYADLLMEFPTAMLGVALGVVLLPQLSAAQAAQEGDRYSALLDWGLRLVVVLGVPAALALAGVALGLLALAALVLVAGVFVAPAFGLGGTFFAFGFTVSSSPAAVATIRISGVVFGWAAAGLMGYGNEERQIGMQEAGFEGSRVGIQHDFTVERGWKRRRSIGWIDCERPRGFEGNRQWCR